MTFTEILKLPKRDIEALNALCEGPLALKDFYDNDLSKFSCVRRFTVKFSNGFESDLKVCTGDIGDSSWTEMVLFTPDGSEAGFTEVSDSLDGPWEIEYFGDVYKVEVMEEDEQKV